MNRKAQPNGLEPASEPDSRETLPDPEGSELRPRVASVRPVDQFDASAEEASIVGISTGETSVASAKQSKEIEKGKPLMGAR